MLGGGPASQHPRLQSQQIRGLLPRAVTLLSLRYPQLLCVFRYLSRRFSPSCSHQATSSIDFWRQTDRLIGPAIAAQSPVAQLTRRFRVKDARMRGRVLHQSGTTAGRDRQTRNRFRRRARCNNRGRMILPPARLHDGELHASSSFQNHTRDCVAVGESPLSARAA